MKKIKNLVGIIFLSIIIFSCQTDNDFKALDQEEVSIEKRHRTLADYIQDDPNVTYFIRPGCDDEYLTAVNDGVDAYNNIIGTSLEFTLATSEATADIVFDCGDFGQECKGGEAILGEDSFGDVLDNQTLVQINKNGMNCCDQNNPVPFTPCQLKAIVMHELGHGIGFAHTNAPPKYVVDYDAMYEFPNGDIEYINPVYAYTDHLAGTPDGDAHSLFNDGTKVTPRFCDGGCPGFSSNDIKAIRLLYPASETCRCECALISDIYTEIWTEYIECDQDCPLPEQFCKKIIE